MIFTIGVIVFAVGWVLVEIAHNNPAPSAHYLDALGTTFEVIGALAMVTSALSLAWRYLP